MNSNESLEQTTLMREINERYNNASPFPHIVIDDFWNQDELEQATDEIENMPEGVWTGNLDGTSNESVVQQKKMALNLPESLEGHAPTMQRVMRTLNSPQFISWLERLTGIPNLYADEKNLGGGLHRTRNGGKLSIHSDFNYHPITLQHRRLNALLYLNRDWKYNGNLELWEPDMSHCVHSISPIFNRLVVFNTTDKALHGHPEKLVCPDDVSRLSLAMYYYSDDRPADEKAPFHMAKWYERPNIGY